MENFKKIGFIVSGMCFGYAIAALIRFYQDKAEKDKEQIFNDGMCYARQLDALGEKARAQSVVKTDNEKAD